MSADEFQYLGSELELFAHAKNWKSYYERILRPYIQGSVLEVGAGIGGTTQILSQRNQKISKWTCLEPDAEMVNRLAALSNQVAVPLDIRKGYLSSLNSSEKFDCILYIDVLEHIEADAKELELALSHLTPSGSLVILSPAHQSLFSAFDKAIGHFRRYDDQMLRDITPKGLHLEKILYLDSAGFFLSLANRLLLHQSNPTLKQVRFWDRCIVPLSRITDPLCANKFGKSIVAIWKASSKTS